MMDEDLPSWEDLDGSRQAADLNLPVMFAQAFSGKRGAALMANLRACARLDVVVPPTVSEAEARFVEGQRSVVLHIAAMLNRAKAQ